NAGSSIHAGPPRPSGPAGARRCRKRGTASSRASRWRRSAASDGAPTAAPGPAPKRRVQPTCIGACGVSRSRNARSRAEGRSTTAHPLARTSRFATTGFKFVRILPLNGERRPLGGRLEELRRVVCLVLEAHGAPPETFALRTTAATCGRTDIPTTRRPACQHGAVSSCGTQVSAPAVHPAIPTFGYRTELWTDVLSSSDYVSRPSR